jgi:hypothetical protein
MVSIASKIKCLARELKMREALYPKRVAEGRMHKSTADYEIEVMRAILKDYQDKAKELQLY